MNENGICSEQRLVITGDLIRLLAHRPQVFPRANYKVDHSNYDQYVDRLIALLLSIDDDELSTKEIEDRLGRSWADVSGNLKKHKDYERTLEAIGWTYVQGRGRRRGCFRRIVTETEKTAEQNAYIEQYETALDSAPRQIIDADPVDFGNYEEGDF